MLGEYSQNVLILMILKTLTIGISIAMTKLVLFTPAKTVDRHSYILCVCVRGQKTANALDTPISHVTSKTGQKKQTDDTLVCTRMMQICLHTDDSTAIIVAR